VRALERARGQFVRAVSHELRTPLTALTGTIENLRDEARPDQQPQLEALEGEVARLGRLVGELLRPSPDGALTLAESRPVDLAALAAELCALLQGRASRAGVALECVAAQGLPQVRGDGDRLRQALLNLLDNALKFTPPGGRVSIAVKAGEWRGGGAILASVEDEGPGIPASLGERAWERDVSAPAGDQGSGGAGLGLAIVREIARAHGGDAWAEGVEPHGTRFVLALPIGR
jgi:signal transduction histidine kinase